MKKHAGLWIDHREAIVVTFADGVEQIKRIVNLTHGVFVVGGAYAAFALWRVVP